MPTYSYQCGRCDRVAELRHGMNESPGCVCTCASPAQPMKRVILSAPSFKLKGNGWYETDFKHK